MNQNQKENNKCACYNCGEIDRQDTGATIGMEIVILVIVMVKRQKDEDNEKKNKGNLIKKIPNPLSAHRFDPLC